MAKKKAAVGWAKANGLLGVVVYFTPEEHKNVRVRAAESGVSMREFLRQSGLTMSPEKIQKKS